MIKKDGIEDAIYKALTHECLFTTPEWRLSLTNTLAASLRKYIQGVIGEELKRWNEGECSAKEALTDLLKRFEGKE